MNNLRLKCDFSWEKRNFLTWDKISFFFVKINSNQFFSICSIVHETKNQTMGHTIFLMRWSMLHYINIKKNFLWRLSLKFSTFSPLFLLQTIYWYLLVCLEKKKRYRGLLLENSRFLYIARLASSAEKRQFFCTFLTSKIRIQMSQFEVFGIKFLELC